MRGLPEPEVRRGHRRSGDERQLLQYVGNAKAPYASD